MHPKFPDFKPIQLEDKDFIQSIFTKYQPKCSEYTFTNLFIWRSHYGIQWSVYKDWLFIIGSQNNAGFYAWQPIGPPPSLETTHSLLAWLKEEKGEENPYISRAGERLVSEIEGDSRLSCKPDKDNFDYVYRTEDLISLSGKRYHAKRNHINKFQRTNSFTYSSMNDGYVKRCLELADEWCLYRRCSEDLSLIAEWNAIKDVLVHYNDLDICGGVILVGNEVRAFALGELLNKETAVVHIEKASPNFPALYAIINQQFCENQWKGIPFINREQDLGIEGMRKAKRSYHPNHQVEKFRIQLK